MAKHIINTKTSSDLALKNFSNGDKTTIPSSPTMTLQTPITHLLHHKATPLPIIKKKKNTLTPWTNPQKQHKVTMTPSQWKNPRTLDPSRLLYFPSQSQPPNLDLETRLCKMHWYYDWICVSVTCGTAWNMKNCSKTNTTSSSCGNSHALQNPTCLILESGCTCNLLSGSCILVRGFMPNHSGRRCSQHGTSFQLKHLPFCSLRFTHTVNV